MDYLEFELEIGVGSGREYPIAVVRSAGGEARETMRFPFDELVLESRLKDVQIALLRSGGTRRNFLLPEERAVREFGSALFNALFTGDVRAQYAVMQDQARARGRGVRLKLRIQAPELAALPWEFLYDTRIGNYLCLSSHTPLVRYLEVAQAPQVLSVTPPLSILAMTASPRDWVELDLQRERRLLETALEPLQNKGLVKLTWLEGPGWFNLQKAMRHGPWHIFHFFGHGGFSEATQEGLIVLENEAGKAYRLYATRLSQLLTDHHSLRLVVLNSCEGAKGNDRDIFSSTAATLVRNGIPAVLAMQYEITDQAALALSRAFYDALADGLAVDTAVSEARKAINLEVENTLEWGTPVLYMRSPDGVLFDLKQPALSNVSLSPESIHIPANNESLSLRLWHIPYRRNPFFTGREDILRTLYEALTADKVAALSQPQAISGLGGIGKTQTALEYAYRYRDNYQVMLWANADTYESLVSDLAAIIELLHLPEKHEQDQSLIINAVKRWLQTSSNWLLILDNVERLEIVSGLIPPFVRGHILMTTRLQAVGRFAGQVEIDKMEPEVGALFLLRRARIIASDAPLTEASEANQNKAREISALMDGLPLALDQAGAYIDETQYGLFRYLDLYQSRRAQLLKRRGQSPFDHPESVTTTFSLSFEKVQQANPAAADLLKLFTFLYPNDIPEEIITKGAVDLGPTLQPVATDPLALNEAIGELLKYSLLRRDPDAQTLTIHRLIQAVLDDMMDEKTRHLWAERAVRAVNKAFPDVDFVTWNLYQRYLPHAHTCAEHIQQWHMEFPEAARLLYQTANYLYNNAQHSPAQSLCQRTLAIREKVLGPEHPDTASSLSQLAWIYYAQSNFAQARQYAQQALALREKALGSNHPDTASSLNQVAVIYRRQGNYAQAEQFYQRALAIYVQTEGIENSQAAFILQNLAVLYHSQHKYNQAEQFQLRALAIRQKIFGPEHRDTTFNYNHLAQIYYAQGKYDQAEKLLQQALTVSEKIFGPVHPALTVSLNSMGRLYYAQGKYDQAELFYQRALTIEQTLQLETLDTTITLNHLARLYRTQGKYDQAESLYRRAIAISEKLFGSGSEHPNLISNLNNLIKLYCIQGKYDQAGSLYRRVLTIHEQTMGPESPNVANVLMKYAELLRKMRRTTEAAELEARAATIKAQSLPETFRKRPPVR